MLQFYKCDRASLVLASGFLKITALNAKLIFGFESRVFITAHWHSNFSRLPAVSVVFKICFG